MKKIYVIGAGVSGMSSAVRLAEYFQTKDVRVIVIAEKMTPYTLSDMVAGLWGPYLTGSTKVEKLIQWSKGSHDFFHKLWIEGSAEEAGITMAPVVKLSREESKCDPFWRNIPFGFEELSANEVTKYSNEHGRNYLSGCRFVSFCCLPKKFLPFLTKRFLKAGGKIQHGKVSNFDDINDADLIVNCTGFGGKVLGDDELYPIRGQIIRVKAPWVYQVISDNSKNGVYVIPNDETVVLGGTSQVNDYNLSASKSDLDFIEQGCQKMIKSLANAEKVNNCVGLRPGRSSIRLEIEFRRNGKVPIIHNVGHGGCGVTLSWGCATEVLNHAIGIINTAPKL